MATALPTALMAHASEQGFVLLLPTAFYTGVGVVAVFLTVVALVIVPRSVALGLFRTIRVWMPNLRAIKPLTQMASALFLCALIWIGLSGPRDPLSNPLVLVVWVVFWIGLVSIQGFLGDVWRFLTPFKGLLRWARLLAGTWRYQPWPKWLGHWPAVVGFGLFAYVLLADPKPSDPVHLARLVGVYVLFQLAATFVFGPRWLARCETFTVVMGLMRRVAFIGPDKRIGLLGWQLLEARPLPLSLAVLCVFILATGSFDGLNETFWWLGLLGMNPLEFSGRSAVQWHNAVGLVVANSSLLAVFSLSLWIGLKLSKSSIGLTHTIRVFAPTLLPIALGYHVAHYLPSFLVDSQYVLVALSDPFLTGADILGLGEFYVTTGFFNSTASVRLIYLTQAWAVGLGHVLAVLAAHAVALRTFGSHKSAVLSQAPLAVFMVAYTFFGLWLLASPRF